MAFDGFAAGVGATFAVTLLLGDTRRRIALVWAGTYASAVIFGGLALWDGADGPRFVMAAVVFAPAALFLVLLDLVARYRRAI